MIQEGGPKRGSGLLKQTNVQEGQPLRRGGGQSSFVFNPGFYRLRAAEMRGARTADVPWHPAEPGGVPAQHPPHAESGPEDTLVEPVRPVFWQAVTRLRSVARRRLSPGVHCRPMGWRGP